MSEEPLDVAGIGSMVVDRVHHSRPSIAACMNSSLTRTELLAFWKQIEP